MIKQVNTVFLIEEINTDGHSPMRFLCDDFKEYICKYRINPKKEEIDFLVYEIVCHFLLKSMDIPTPNIALVKISKDSLDINKLSKNKKYAKEGVICFASERMKDTDLVNGLQKFTKSSLFNKLINPYDLLKIAIFDLWVENIDRGRHENYNLLIQSITEESDTKKTNKLQYIAFDHAFAFGGVDDLRILNKSKTPSSFNKLIETQYFKEYKKHLNKNRCLDIINNLVPLNIISINIILDYVFSQLPISWKIHPSLKGRIFDFLTNMDRIKMIKLIAEQNIN